MDDYPVQLKVDYPQTSSRILALFSIPFFIGRALLLIPTLFVLYFLGIAALFAAWISMWAITFTGKYPEGIHRFVRGFLQWQTRAYAYMYGLTDKYPPFRLQ